MDYLILVDSVKAFLPDERPELVPVCGLRLERTAAEHCEKMLKAAEQDGIRIKLLSAYRTVEYQRSLWNKSILDLICKGLDEKSAECLTQRTLARPGHSEHHTGLACDFCSPESDDTQEDFYRTEEGRWLCKNAASYGFILRYPRMKEHITGISYEPWHYRFVGCEHAAIIKEQGLTLEEYLHYYIDKNQIL